MALHNWCQGLVPDRGPAVEKYWPNQYLIPALFEKTKEKHQKTEVITAGDLAEIPTHYFTNTSAKHYYWTLWYIAAMSSRPSWIPLTAYAVVLYKCWQHYPLLVTSVLGWWETSRRGWSKYNDRQKGGSLGHCHPQHAQYCFVPLQWRSKKTSDYEYYFSFETWW